MKRIIITASLLFLIIQVQAQSPVIRISDEDLAETKTALDSLKPLIVVQLKQEKFLVEYTGGDDVLGTISPKSIKALNVLKGNAAISLYGQKASNGVIIVTLENNRRNASFFKKLQDGELPASLIDTSVKTEVDEKTSFSLDPVGFRKNGSTKIRGNADLTLSELNQNVFIQIGSHKTQIFDLDNLTDLDRKFIKSIDVVKKNSNGTNNTTKDELTIRLVKNAQTKKFVRKLERIQRKK